MDLSLGKKIKDLRKELKMTQSELAGDEMTKSMLSQIENDIAMPSMKNLQFLAARLGKPTSYFLDENSGLEAQRNTLPVEEIAEKIRNIDALKEKKEYPLAFEKLEDILVAYSFNKTDKIYGDILQRLGNTLVSLKRYDEGREKIKKAVDIYTGISLYLDAAKTYLLSFDISWDHYDYEGCLKVLENTDEYYSQSTTKDSSFQIELLHMKIVTLAALGRISETLATIDRALDLSKETNTYNKSDELHRLKAVIYLYQDKFEDFKYNIEKAEQFAKFTENVKNIGLIELTLAIYHNMENHPDEALRLLEASAQHFKAKIHFHYLEEAKVYYFLKDYEKALNLIDRIEVPSYTLHKLDYLHYWSANILKGTILSETGRPLEAIEAIEEGIEKMELFPHSKYLASAYKTLSEVYSQLKDYENAFNALKKSDEIKEVLEGTEDIL